MEFSEMSVQDNSEIIQPSLSLPESHLFFGLQFSKRRKKLFLNSIREAQITQASYATQICAAPTKLTLSKSSMRPSFFSRSELLLLSNAASFSRVRSD